MGTAAEQGVAHPQYGAAAWGIIGFLALMVQAIVRLGANALIAIQSDLGAVHVASLVGWAVFMVYSEGYRGFHTRFAPRFAARALHLARNPRWLFVVLAPIYCMGLIHATRRRLIVSWCLLLGIVVLVIVVKQLPQPWRGIIDAGVVLGLIVGTISVLWHVARGLQDKNRLVSAEVPGC